MFPPAGPGEPLFRTASRLQPGRGPRAATVGASELSGTYHPGW